MFRGRQRGGGNLGVLLLGAQMMNMGLENIPPVTLALVAGQVAIFLNLLPQYFPSAHNVCMSSYLVWHRGDWRRLLLAVFYHADDMHLYFNMASLLWKGRSLERRFGSPYFFWLVSVFTALTSMGYVAINLLLEEKLHDHSYATQCAVGFSGVIFALKVVTTHYTPPGLHYALGFIPVPSRYIYWVELGLIQLVTPNASFTGHLAGILVGLLYIKGPLKPIMDTILRPASSRRFTQGGQRSGRRYGFFSSGTTGDGDYTAAQGGNGYYPNSGAGLYPDLDELRQRRAARYQ
ncbi:hypothetical protein BaRGS_00025602 [Batillaria attramentaria]|uniref:Peptidase S54 rhomboid domain-containing protein n=1 Tax=Batillaria attramentaria TaxID=370345 RepID=A0ABD0K7Z1_9CAEN